MAQLALISKAKKVFGSDGTFLSFPVMPLAYTKEELDFFSQETADELRQSNKNLHAFSTLVNLIPNDEAWLPTETRFLWEEYEYVLNQGVCASSTRTPEEEVAFKEAKAYLKTPGGITDSQQVQLYKLHKDAHIMVEQEFMEARSTGETTEDETEKKQWLEVDKPAFIAKLEELENKWVLEGYKNQVEIAQSKLEILGAKSPILTWTDWKAQFNPDIESRTEIDSSQEFFPSSFNPSNALEEDAWKPFKLSEAEVKALVKEAPEELQKRFSTTDKESSIKTITLEFSSAVINRSWFDSEVFRSRFWRLSDATKIISDGASPPSGDCPAYVTAIVFARKVAVELKQTQPSPPQLTNLRFNYMLKNQNMLKQIHPSVLKQAQPLSSNNIKMMRMQTVKPLKTKDQNTVLSRPSTIHIPSEIKREKAALLSLKASTFTRLPTKPIRKPAPRPTNPRSVEDKNIYIFAFICKPLSKCPNPDLTLQW